MITNYGQVALTMDFVKPSLIPRPSHPSICCC